MCIVSGEDAKMKREEEMSEIEREMKSESKASRPDCSRR